MSIAAAVAVFLSSTVGRVLQKAASYGAVQPQVSQDEIVEIPVPSGLLQAGAELLGLRLGTDNAIRHSLRLTTAARLLVEALIERKVTEAELIAAHNDPATDRALLARLSSSGLDVPDADPLFPDLDRLEELLADAQTGADA